MKKTIYQLLLSTAICCTAIICQAQTPDPIPSPKWLSEKGFWVVQSNVRTPGSSTVYFYNNAHELMYSEQVTGMRLNLNKRKVLMHLKTVLENAALAWETKSPPADGAVLAVALRKKKN